MKEVEMEKRRAKWKKTGGRPPVKGMEMLRLLSFHSAGEKTETFHGHLSDNAAVVAAAEEETWTNEL